MVAIDASVLIRWFNESLDPADGARVDALRWSGRLCVPPVVVTEFLSGRNVGSSEALIFRRLPRIPLRRGYWDRAGRLRAEMGRRGKRARLGDTLVAQACIDHELPLLTRDRDFQAFAEVGGLMLA